MRIFLFFYITFFFPLKVIACDCDILNPTLEFYESSYVFKGVVNSKVYSQDSLTYTIKFDILKHYKLNDKNPEYLSFKLKSESQYTGEWTSCDWSVYKNQKWLIYAKKNELDEITFSGMCSNSKRINRLPITKKQEEALNKANDFKLDDYVYFDESNFNYTGPITNIDSIIQKGEIKNYVKTFAWLKIHINKKGDIIDIISPKNLKQVRDKSFNLTKEIINTREKSLTLFEKDAIDLLFKVEKWEVKKHKNTNKPVSYIKHISIEFDTSSNKWKYEF